MPNARPSQPTGLVLVSACLAGYRCRFDGRSCPADAVAELVASGRAVPVCPEVDGGLPTPRLPAEIAGGDGADVLDGRARVLSADGRDITAAYLAGAQAALAKARAAGATRALLKARSPSCGCGEIYDGSFSGGRRAGDGVTAALLRRAGITVQSEQDLAAT